MRKCSWTCVCVCVCVCSCVAFVPVYLHTHTHTDTWVSHLVFFPICWCRSVQTTTFAGLISGSWTGSSEVAPSQPPAVALKPNRPNSKVHDTHNTHTHTHTHTHTRTHTHTNTHAHTPTHPPTHPPTHTHTHPLTHTHQAPTQTASGVSLGIEVVSDEYHLADTHCLDCRSPALFHFSFFPFHLADAHCLDCRSLCLFFIFSPLKPQP